MAVKILFQGDSITDVARSREREEYRGSGYATLVSARLGFEAPGKYEFTNRGIAGNRTVDILARIKSDAINLKPDVFSLLIGVNDVWHELLGNNGVEAEIYELYYRSIIEQIKNALPETRIILLEPFVLKGEATLENWENFRSEVEKRAEIVGKLAQEYKLDFIPLMKKFDEVAQETASEFWLMDGVHPTAIGHELIAREWIKVFKNS